MVGNADVEWFSFQASQKSSGTVMQARGADLFLFITCVGLLGSTIFILDALHQGLGADVSGFGGFLSFPRLPRSGPYDRPATDTIVISRWRASQIEN